MLDPGAVDPNLTGILEAAHFSMVVTPLLRVSAQTGLSFTGTPMYSNLRASNSIPGFPRSCCMNSPPMK